MRISVTPQLLIVLTKVTVWIIHAALLARQVIRLLHSETEYSVKLNWFFCFFSRIHDIQLPSVYFSRHFLPEDQQPTPQICGLHWGNGTDIWSVVKQLQKQVALLLTVFFFWVTRLFFWWFSAWLWESPASQLLSSRGSRAPKTSWLSSPECKPLTKDANRFQSASLVRLLMETLLFCFCYMPFLTKAKNQDNNDFYLLVFRPILRLRCPFPLWFFFYLVLSLLCCSEKLPCTLWKSLSTAVTFFHLFHIAHFKVISDLWAQTLICS